jgi:hypothetical protein
VITPVAGKLEITKRPVTLKSANLEKVYDGTALVNGETALETEDGWITGEGATYTFKGSQTDAGNTPNSFTYELKENTKADNYTINKIEGTLTVHKKAITITAEALNKYWGLNDPDLTAVITELDAKNEPKVFNPTGAPVQYELTREAGETVDQNIDPNVKELEEGTENYARNYTITVLAEAEKNKNYEITLIPSALTITKLKPTIDSNMDDQDTAYSGFIVELKAQMLGLDEYPERYTYQWFYSDAENGEYKPIPDATERIYKYVLNSDTAGNYYRVEITLNWDGKQ